MRADDYGRVFLASKLYKGGRPMNPYIDDLKARLTKINDLRGAAALMYWDQATYMPTKGSHARGRQLATLSRMAHEMFIDDETGRLLDAATKSLADPDADTVDAALLRIARRDYERATNVPPEFTARRSRHAAASFAAWTAARPKNDFASVLPYLETTLELSREFADFFPGYDHPADPHIDFADRGMTVARLTKIFSDLRSELVPMLEKIATQAEADDGCLRETFPIAEQYAFAEDVIRHFGYDFERGRYDNTAHPFMIKFAHGDVRITTRASETFLGEALFSMFHEAGHALYEQGVSADYDALPLGSGASSGIHESQSRLWENLVGRSRPFWEHHYPKLIARFPEQLGDVPLDKFYRAINKVRPSFIRTDADELTYNLHVIIRFDLSCAMLEGKLAPKDLPEAWNARYQSDLGVTPSDYSDGCLQDVHWFHGSIGGSFQCYTLGNILSAQFFDKAIASCPTIHTEITQGRFTTLLDWLQKNVYVHGRRYAPDDLIERVTDAPLSIAPYVGYLKKKYGELYEL
jgi:carboxypeptidase Taq